MRNAVLKRLSVDSLIAFKERALPMSVPRNVYWEEITSADGSFFFPETGFFSQVTAAAEGYVEVQTIGQDGYLGSIFTKYGTVATKYLTVAKAAGYRLSMVDFDALSKAHREFKELCDRFTDVTFNRVAQSAACIQLHSIEERAARWLINSHRLSSQMAMIATQKEISNLIGCARPGLNIALVALQKKGLLELSRSSIELLDIPGLEQVSCECLAQQSQLYGITMGFELIEQNRESAA